MRTFLFIACWLSCSWLSAIAAERVTTAQERAAAEFLAAAASGDAQAVALALHPGELEALRVRILQQLREEAGRQTSVIRTRLFGAGMPLDELERLTPIGFYAALARKLQIGSRQYRDVNGIAALPDKNGVVLAVVRGVPPRERGTVSIVHVVAIKPYGKDWKAVIPAQIEAQLEDLIAGRATAGVSEKVGAEAVDPAAATAINTLLDNAIAALEAEQCDKYYQDYLSPAFRRITAAQALRSLIETCRTSLGTRQMLLSTVKIVRQLTPQMSNAQQRAIYDLSGQGLPYNQFVLEQVDKRWYIAE
jgi:hypothetical protein